MYLFLNKMTILNLTLSSLRTSDCPQRSWASRFPQAPSPRSMAPFPPALCPSHQFCDGRRGPPVRQKDEGDPGHTWGGWPSLPLVIHLSHPGRWLPHSARLPPGLVAHVTCPDEAPSLQQQHHDSPLQVLGAVGAQQPRGVAQRSQDAPVQQVGGHVCIHGGQRVVEEV